MRTLKPSAFLSLALGLYSLGLLTACGGSNFKGSAQSGPVAKQSSTPSSVPAVPPSQDAKANIPPVPPPSASPDNAIVKGSFTAYIEPKNPKAQENYKIFIKVKLPTGKAAGYTKDDLNIQMIGTDGFSDAFPRPPLPGANIPPEFNQSFTVMGDEVLVVMPIPGAVKNVKDTIQCSSKLLNESQKIEFVFGAK